MNKQLLIDLLKLVDKYDFNERAIYAGMKKRILQCCAEPDGFDRVTVNNRIQGTQLFTVKRYILGGELFHTRTDEKINYNVQIENEFEIEHPPHFPDLETGEEVGRAIMTLGLFYTKITEDDCRQFNFLMQHFTSRNAWEQGAHIIRAQFEQLIQDVAA